VIEPHRSIGGFFIRQPDGTLDQRQYYGFYELTNNRHRSVTFWGNMQPANEKIDEPQEVSSL